jgi:hypothetical protein
MMMLLWSEQIGGKANAIFFNNISAADLCQMQEGQDVAVLPAGHGGEGEDCLVLVSSAMSALSAGLGGEGEGSCSLYSLFCS